MVLSSYFDWQTDVPTYERKTVEAESETQLAAADGLECYWNAFELPYTFPASYLDRQNYTSLLPLYSIPPEVIPYETLSSYPRPKRHKLIEDHYCSDLMPGVFDGVAVSPCPVLEDHQINLERMKTVGNCNKISEEKCVSVQSIAARERRRKITKKTQELGKLVPGGSKMNTAEMLQSAFKYIKYLQAQVGTLQVMDSFPVILRTLQVMDSFPENEKRSWDGKMEMVTSPKVQEKLYMEDKCLVAKDVVLSLTTLFKPPLSHELTRLLSLPSND